MKKPFVLMGCMPCILWAAMADNVHIEGAYIREILPERTTTAAYMRLQNTGDAPAVITAVHTPIAGGVLIHTTVVDSQHVMHMDHMKALEIPAQSTVDLAPGGLHIMLTNVIEGVNVGSKTKMTFDFEDGSKTTITAPVRPIS